MPNEKIFHIWNFKTGFRQELWKMSTQFTGYFLESSFCPVKQQIVYSYRPEGGGTWCINSAILNLISPSGHLSLLRVQLLSFILRHLSSSCVRTSETQAVSDSEKVPRVFLMFTQMDSLWHFTVFNPEAAGEDPENVQGHWLRHLSPHTQRVRNTPELQCRSESILKSFNIQNAFSEISFCYLDFCLKNKKNNLSHIHFAHWWPL